MKKIIATAILAGCTIFGANANAGDFTLGLPGFLLKITDGFRTETVTTRHYEIKHHRHEPAHKPAIRPRRHNEPARKTPPAPPKPNGRHR